MPLLIAIPFPAIAMLLLPLEKEMELYETTSVRSLFAAIFVPANTKSAPASGRDGDVDQLAAFDHRRRRRLHLSKSPRAGFDLPRARRRTFAVCASSAFVASCYPHRPPENAKHAAQR